MYMHWDLLDIAMKAKFHNFTQFAIFNPFKPSGVKWLDSKAGHTGLTGHNGLTHNFSIMSASACISESYKWWVRPVWPWTLCYTHFARIFKNVGMKDPCDHRYNSCSEYANLIHNNYNYNKIAFQSTADQRRIRAYAHLTFRASVTLILDLDLDMLKMCLRIENEVY